MWLAVQEDVHAQYGPQVYAYMYTFYQLLVTSIAFKHLKAPAIKIQLIAWLLLFGVKLSTPRNISRLSAPHRTIITTHHVST